jgi:leader peptidase (prepilin peptidase)/N-methyltransferase
VGAVLGAVAGAGFLLVVAVGYEKLRRRQGLGMGDVKMMAMAGAFLGWPLVLFAISVGSVLCLAVGIFLIIFRGMTLQTKMAFGVFLGMGTAVSLFYGPQFFSWWLNIGR